MKKERKSRAANYKKKSERKMAAAAISFSFPVQRPSRKMRKNGLDPKRLEDSEGGDAWDRKKNRGIRGTKGRTGGSGQVLTPRGQERGDLAGFLQEQKTEDKGNLRASGDCLVGRREGV